MNISLLDICYCAMEDSNQLMTLMMEEVQMIHPRHRNRFIDLCVNKEQKCTAAQFQGPNAIFSWRAGVDLLDKVHRQKELLMSYV